MITYDLTGVEGASLINDAGRTWRHRIARFVWRGVFKVRPCEFVSVERSLTDGRLVMNWECRWWATEDDVRRRLRHSRNYVRRCLRKRGGVAEFPDGWDANVAYIVSPDKQSLLRIRVVPGGPL